MKLLVTGGSSFVGAHFCRRAVRLHEVVALHHQTPLALNGVTPLRCDLRHPAAIERLRRVEADAVVHLACKAIGPGAAIQAINRRLMDVVLAQGIPVVYASSTMVHWSGRTAYGECRVQDEARLTESGLPHAILRPAAPYGPRLKEHSTGHVESFHTLSDLVRTSPVVPVMGDGRVLRQPLHVHDFCDAILALLRHDLPSRAYDAAGSQVLTMDELIATLSWALNRRVRVLHLPKRLFLALAALKTDLDPELVGVFDTDDVVDEGPLAEATQVRFRPFREGVVDLR